MQRPDGGWDENPVLPGHDLPPWIVPSSPTTRLYLSSYAAYWLGFSRRTQPPAFPRALAFLATHQQPDGSFPGYRHTNWLAISALLFGADAPHLPGNGVRQTEPNGNLAAASAAVQPPGVPSDENGKSKSADHTLDSEAGKTGKANITNDYTQAIQQGIAFLAAIPFAEWEDSQVGWMLDCFSRAGLTVEHPFIAAALAELLRRQGADGSWAPDEGPVFAASATVTALKVIKRLTSLPPLA
jgi:hypothetical protein